VANPRYWLMKSEANCFSFDDLMKAPAQTTFWDGIRNFEARNFLRDQVQKGDLVLFYHTLADPPGVAGIAKVVQAGYPDHTAFDAKHEHYDPKSREDKPTWYMVDLKAVKPLKRYVDLPEIRNHNELQNMWLLKRNRLSVTPVTEQEFQLILELGKTKL